MLGSLQKDNGDSNKDDNNNKNKSNNEGNNNDNDVIRIIEINTLQGTMQVILCPET